MHLHRIENKRERRKKRKVPKEKKEEREKACFGFLLLQALKKSLPLSLTSSQV
jgi:hypothetical protein